MEHRVGALSVGAAAFQVLDLLFYLVLGVVALLVAGLFLRLRRRGQARSFPGRLLLIVFLVIVLLVVLKLFQEGGGSGGRGGGPGGGGADAGAGRGTAPDTRISAVLVYDPTAPALHLDLRADDAVHHRSFPLRDIGWETDLQAQLGVPLRRAGLARPQHLRLRSIDGRATPLLLRHAIAQVARRAGWSLCAATPGGER